MSTAKERIPMEERMMKRWQNKLKVMPTGLRVRIFL
jgi:hypothetical protein